MNESAESYRRQWAMLAHRSPSDVYIPTALRPADAGDRVEILRDGLQSAEVGAGEVLMVIGRDSADGFMAVGDSGLLWCFDDRLEGEGWRRVPETFEEGEVRALQAVSESMERRG